MFLKNLTEMFANSVQTDPTIAEEFIYSDCEKTINAIYLKFWIDT